MMLPKLKPDEKGVWDKLGWYLDQHELYPQKDIVVLQCKFGHGSWFGPEYTIGRDGKVTPMTVCPCLKFEADVQLADWPQNFFKPKGQEFITKLFAVN